mgnify:CR=1 FL=1
MNTQNMSILNTQKRLLLRKKSKQLKPIVRLGKSGLSEGTLREIVRQLKKKSLIKLRLLNSFLRPPDKPYSDNRKRQVIEELCLKTGAELIDATGNVVVLYKKSKKADKKPTP